MLTLTRLNTVEADICHTHGGYLCQGKTMYGVSIQRTNDRPLMLVCRADVTRDAWAKDILLAISGR